MIGVWLSIPDAPSPYDRAIDAQLVHEIHAGSLQGGDQGAPVDRVGTYHASMIRFAHEHLCTARDPSEHLPRNRVARVRSRLP